MKIYTRTGDTGTTSLVGGARVKKNSTRVEAYGTVDELNAAIGLLTPLPAAQHPQVAPTIRLIQNRLFDLGAYLANDNPDAPTEAFGATTVETIEKAIDTLAEATPPQTAFILPGGCEAATRAHMARTVARRAERRTLDLADTTPVSPDAIKLLNRISDYLFTLARFFNHIEEKQEIYWQKNC